MRHQGRVGDLCIVGSLADLISARQITDYRSNNNTEPYVSPPYRNQLSAVGAFYNTTKPKNPYQFEEFQHILDEIFLDGSIPSRDSMENCPQLRIRSLQLPKKYCNLNPKYTETSLTTTVGIYKQPWTPK